MLNIYCDESGYTGGDLLDKDQPYFVYSAVNFTESELKDIKNYIYTNYNIQNDEIKGKLIVNNKKYGQPVIKYIFEKYADKIRVVFHEKKYVLAAKIVEYCLEPYLTSNYFFYKSKLNDYIATRLYLSFISKDYTAEELFQNFLQLLRGKIEYNESMFINYSENNSLLDFLFKIINFNPSIVLKEIDSDNSGTVDKWILDLTITSIICLLTEWGKNADLLNVVCDNSKVFLNNPLFDFAKQMGKIGRTEILDDYLGYNLNQDIEVKDSKGSIGLQIADLAASTVFYCLNNKESQFSKDIMDVVYKNCICRPNSFCVLPKISEIEKEFKVNNRLYQSLLYMIYMNVLSKYGINNNGV